MEIIKIAIEIKNYQNLKILNYVICYNNMGILMYY